MTRARKKEFIRVLSVFEMKFCYGSRSWYG